MKSSPWGPAIVLSAGALLATVGVHAQRSLPLRGPLASAVTDTIEGYLGRDVVLAPEEERVAGVTNYLSRVFETRDTATAGPRFFTLYVGYYESQTSGRTIHSPKNCLPGAGWQPLTNSRIEVATEGGHVTVNQWLIQKGQEQAIVLYWYQGRGRVAANEYLVKWDLVRDAALRHRSEEALVRVVVPIRGGEEAALQFASRVAGRIVPDVRAALPS